MKNLERGFALVPLLLVLGLLIIGGSFYIYKNNKIEIPVVKDTKIDVKETSSFVFTFPKKDSVLIEGQTYNITWDGGNISSTTHYAGIVDKNGGYIRLLDETGAFMSEKSISWKVLHLETFGERSILPGDGFRIAIFPIGKFEEAQYSPTFSIRN